MHRASNTWRHVTTAGDAAYNRIAIGIFSAYLPTDRREEITRKARRSYALSAMETAHELFRNGERGGFAQLKEALRLDPSAGIILQALGIALTSRRGRADAG
jgi:hypothetical protein